MAKVGRYRSRRRGGAAVAGGGVVAKVLNQQLKQAVHGVKHAVHHAADHDPMEVLEAVQKHIPHHPEEVGQILQEASRNLADYHHHQHIPAMHNYTTSYPNMRGPDPMAFARHLRQKHLDTSHKDVHADHQRVAGGLDFKAIGDNAKALVDTFNPADSVNKGMDQLDKINFRDTSVRGVAKNALHGYSGYLHGQAAYSQATGLAVSPFSAMDAGIPTAGLMALGLAQNKFGDATGALARRL